MLDMRKIQHNFEMLNFKQLCFLLTYFGQT